MTTVISFFTRDWEYPKYANNLKADCERLGLPYVIEELPTTGSYLKNTCMKPKFIKTMLEKIKGPVLWVDCDGSILKYPAFFKDLECDMAARKKPIGSDRTWHVGTMWFNYTDSAIQFLKYWIKNTGRLSDESALERTWKEKQINAVNIPEDYFILLKRRNDKARGVICHRVSNGIVKRREMVKAKVLNRKGIS